MLAGGDTNEFKKYCLASVETVYNFQKTETPVRI